MPIAQLPFPAVVGARDKVGRVCVGSKPSRSKHCRTNLVFYDRVKREEHGVLATDVDWMLHDAKTSAVLLDGLRDVVHQKVTVKFDRGLMVGQYRGSRFYLMEAAGGMLWPRYKWWLPFQIPEWNQVIPLLIRYETLRPDVLVGEDDKRQPTRDLPTDRADDGYCPVRMCGSHREFVDDLVKWKAVQAAKAAP